MSLADIRPDTQLAIWGYSILGNTLERSALHAEMRSDRGVDLCHDDWDATAADLAKIRRYLDGQRLETPAWWALSWWARTWIELMAEVQP